MREDWEYKELGEVCDIYQPKTISNEMLVKGGKYPVYGANGTIGFYNRYNHTDSEILLTCRGATCGTINVSQPYSWINGNAMVIHRKSDYLDFKYLYFLMTSLDYSLIINGAAQPQITRARLAPIQVAIPPKPTQLSIVSELDKLNELIQIKKEQLKDYDALAQSIFYEMFGDPVENEKGWEVKKLKDMSRKIGDGLHGTPEYSELDTGWYFINGNNLENGCISIKSTTKKVTDFVRKKYYVEMDDFTLLVSINGTLGKSAFYNGENVILGKSACYIKLNKDVNKLFIYEIIRGEYFKRYAESVCTGTTIRNVSLKAMREFPIIYPPLPLQHSFAQKIEQIEQQKATIQKTITDLETLLAARMQYWFD